MKNLDLRGLRRGRLLRPVLQNFHALAWNLVAGVVIARMLAPQDRGYVAVVVTLAGVAALLAALGVGTAYRASIYRDTSINSTLYRLAVHGLAIALCLPLLFVGAWVTGAYIDARAKMLLGTILFVINGLASFYRQAVTEELLAHGRVDTVARVTVIGSFGLAVAVGIPWALGIGPRAELALGAYASSSLLRTYLTWRNVKSLRESGQWSWQGLRCLFQRGVRVAGFTFGQELTFRVDRFAIGLFGGTAQAGLYTVATTPAEVLRVPVTVAGQYTMYDHAGSNRPGKKVLLTGFVAGLAIIATLPVVWLLGEPVIVLVYGEPYREAAMLLLVLVAAQALLSPYLIWSRALAGEGAELSVSVAGLIGVLCISVLCAVLIPQYGSGGAATAVALTYAVMSMLTGANLMRRMAT